MVSSPDINDHKIGGSCFEWVTADVDPVWFHCAKQNMLLQFCMGLPAQLGVWLDLVSCQRCSNAVTHL